MNEIFLSYRRADEKGTTGRMFDHLAQAFGRDAIFYDVEKIPHGVDFRQFIDRTIRDCKVVLVVIGPQWLTLADAKGRRLDQWDDPVRIEVETALRWRKRVIPVLIDEAQMPAAAYLPATIQQLAPQNAAPLHNNQYFDQDINALLDDITRMGVPRKTQGYIVNPPSANFLNKRQTAAIISVPLVLVTIGLLVVLGVCYVGYLAIKPSLSSLNFLTNSSATNGAHSTLTDFCNAIHNDDDTTAYNDLTSAFQAKIGSASDLPTHLITDINGQQATVTGCHAWSQGSPDPGYHENGNTANDEVVFNLTNSFSPESVKVMYFVKQSGVWKIDDLQAS